MRLFGATGRFARYLEATRGYSSHTVRAYSSDLAQLGDYLLIKGVDLDLDEIDTDHLKSWLISRYESGTSPVTLARWVSVLRTFFTWARAEGYVEDNPALRLRSPRLQKKLPPVLAEGRVDQILERLQLGIGSLQGADRAVAVRDWAMVEVLYGGGLRVSELTGLNLESLRLAEGVLRVVGKGDKERITPVGRKASLALNEYLDLRFELCSRDSGSALFLGKAGRRINPGQVYRLVAKFISAEPRGPHAFRHAAATHMLDHGADLRILQEFLGHKSLSTTQGYTRVSLERIRASYNNAHPRA